LSKERSIVKANAQGPMLKAAQKTVSSGQNRHKTPPGYAVISLQSLSILIFG